MTDAALVWLRRDLRADDNAALHHALARARRVYCVFVFDTTILDRLQDRADRRVEFILGSLVELDRHLDQRSRANGGAGSGLIVRHGDPVDRIPALALELGVGEVHCNRDYEPDAIRRDHEVGERLGSAGIALHTHKDLVIFENDEVLTRAGTPFTVFTPYRRAWLERFAPAVAAEWAIDGLTGALARKPEHETLPRLADIGFEASDLASLPITPGSRAGQALLAEFEGRIARYPRWAPGCRRR